MIPQPDTRTIHGHAAINLLCRWEGHELGSRAAADTLSAAFGEASPATCFADEFVRNNSPYPSWLADIARDQGVVEEPPPLRPGERIPLFPLPRASSRATLAMVGRGFGYVHGRRVTLTKRALAALLGYFRERTALLMELEVVLSGSRRVEAIRHGRACRELIKWLEVTPTRSLTVAHTN